MVFNVTFNNMSAISWQSVLLVEQTGVPDKTTDLPQVTNKLFTGDTGTSHCKSQLFH